MDEPFVKLDVDGAVGWLILNEPERVTPVNGERIHEINRAATEFSARDDIRVVVITGAGRAFCAGADISASATRGRDVTIRCGDPSRRAAGRSSETCPECGR